MNINEIKSLGVPFGFKLNAFIKTNPKPNYTDAYKVSKTGKFYKKPEQSLLGLDKVIAQAELAKKAANEQWLSAAKEPLKNIDNLRKKYHELHEPPGFYELLFGS